MAVDIELANQTGLSPSKVEDEDEAMVLAMGYKQELYRGFSATMDLAFCFTAVSVLSSICLLLSYGLNAGGPAVIVYSWLIGSFFTVLAGASMAEICSAYPSAGSVYHWAGSLAPEKWAPLFSFATGWANFVGNVAGDAAFGSAFGLFCTAGYNMSIADESKHLSEHVGTGIAIAACVVWALMNIMRVDQQGWINLFATGWQVAATLIVIIAVAVQAGGSAQSASFVFTKYNNSTGFESVPYVLCLGLLTTLYSFSGYEAGAHMAEETQGATLAAPKSIIYTCLSVSVIGFALILALLFGIPDFEAILSAENAAVSIFFRSSATLGQFLTVLLAVNTFFAGISSLTVTSRIGYAMARDRAFPGSGYLSKVSDGTKTPVRVVMLVLALDIAMLMIAFASSVAFTAITSVTTIGYQVSYAAPILLRVTAARHSFVPAAFSLGALSKPVGWLSGVWLLVTSIFFFFPTAHPITGRNMNYACVVVGLFAAVGAVYWAFWARHFFTGPPRKESVVVYSFDPQEDDLQVSATDTPDSQVLIENNM